jgi:hypothetical protein
MTGDPLIALHRHFEEQYGTLSIPRLKSKKRKRHQVEEEVQKEDQAVDSAQEWFGIQDNPIPKGPDPQVISFTESTDIIEEEDATSYKSFMVCVLKPTHCSHRNYRKPLPSRTNPKSLAPRPRTMKR